MIKEAVIGMNVAKNQVSHSTSIKRDKNWMAKNVTSRPLAADAEAVARLQMRKEQAGAGHRADIKCFVDVIEADENRI